MARRGAILLAAIAAFATMAAPAGASFPGEPGEIFFGENRSVKAIGPQGHGERTVARTRGNVVSLSVSPDGTRIAYVANVFDGFRHYGRIWIKAIRGGGPGPGRSLWRRAYPWPIEYVTFSADGRRLVYSLAPRGHRRNFDDTELFSVRLDGTGRRRLTHNDKPDNAPVASPNGGWIAFQRGRDIFRIRIDGSQPQRLTSGPDGDFEPEYSPDGDSILFARSLDGQIGPGHIQLFLMNKRGEDERRLQLTSDTMSFGQTAFSPAGGTLAGFGFCFCQDGEHWGDVFASDLDGPLEWIKDREQVGATGLTWGVRPGTAP
jgi:dipeptidyl aminopeptidase/acylaminoacyl peptidase